MLVLAGVVYAEAAIGPEQLGGKWSGSIAFTDFKVGGEIPIPDSDLGVEGKFPQTIQKEECEGIMEESMGVPSDLTMEFVPETAETGTVILDSASGTSSDQGPTPLPYRVSGDTITAEIEQDGARISMEAKVTEQEGVLVMDGGLTVAVEVEGMDIMEMIAQFSVSKPR